MIAFEHLGAALRLLREERGWSRARLQEMAKHRGVRLDSAALSKWEGQRTNPTMQSLSRHLTALGANLLDLQSALVSVAAGEDSHEPPSATAAKIARSLLGDSRGPRPDSPERTLLEECLTVAALLDRDAKRIAFYAGDLAQMALRFQKAAETAELSEVAEAMAALYFDLRRFKASLIRGLLIDSRADVEADGAARDAQKVERDEGNSPREEAPTCKES